MQLLNLPTGVLLLASVVSITALPVQHDIAALEAREPLVIPPGMTGLHKPVTKKKPGGTGMTGLHKLITKREPEPIIVIPPGMTGLHKLKPIERQNVPTFPTWKGDKVSWSTLPKRPTKEKAKAVKAKREPEPIIVKPPGMTGLHKLEPIKTTNIAAFEKWRAEDVAWSTMKENIAKARAKAAQRKSAVKPPQAVRNPQAALKARGIIRAGGMTGLHKLKTPQNPGPIVKPPGMNGLHPLGIKKPPNYPVHNQWLADQKAWASLPKRPTKEQAKAAKARIAQAKANAAARPPVVKPPQAAPNPAGGFPRKPTPAETQAPQSRT
ncbi:hypothetical protein HYFRA_00005165 [Hymenoscyphus fraxineus]|uniref:Uncharacterized protein n=1 Tax=Hymenoscyphus fraxineus TaxID=746836 RepID=A0A9N9Q1V7_9HELO|nr:hypothetical protein HYFRA_00005165 [Hymenoscyphus fraxineus]